MTRNSDKVARREPNGDGVASLSSARAAASSQSAACLVELDLSSVSLPTDIGDGAAAESLPPVRPQSEGRCHDGFKPYRDIVTTQVYTIPSREGVPVRLSIPIEQQQLRHGARAVGVHTARCTHPSRPERSRTRRSKSPAAGRHLSVRVAASVPSVTQQILVDPSVRTSSSKVIHFLASSHPNRIIRGGGVSSQVEHDRCHHHPQTPRTAQRSARQRIHLKTSVPVRARDTTKRWKSEGPQPPIKPRPLSAPARGRAVRRAVDRCCTNLPAMSELTFGAARFLRQWDGASRRQRREILKALADQLLVSGQGGGYDEQQPRPSLLVEVQSNEGNKRAEGTTELISGQQVHRRETPDTSDEFYSHRVLGASDVASNVFDSISAKKNRHHSFYHGDQSGASAQPGGTTITNDYANGTGFLELLGAHAGLLATRISSYLRTLHSCGHAIGLCLRVTTLLAEPTFETAHGGSGGSGSRICSGSGNDSIATSLAQQLSTPGIIRVALETVAAKSAAKSAANLAASPAADPAAEPVRTRTGTRTSSLPSREVEKNRAQALRLLLVLVRAGGRPIKEHLTCSPSIPGADKSDDALGPIMVALRQFDCALGTRTAAGKLLVELGVGNPAGSGRVWNAVLFVLGQDACREAQILGCNVARQLLSTLGAGCSSSDNGYFQSKFMWGQEHQLRPEVLMVPSVLNLSLSDCSATREAAGKLAVCLASVSGRCCYLLITGLIGLLGNISGVKRTSPLAWRRRHRTSRYDETTTSRNEDELEVRWSELRQPNHRRVVAFTGRESNSYALNEEGIFCAVDLENPGGNTGSQQCERVGVDSSESVANKGDKFFDGETARSAARSADDDNHVIRAMETLRLIISEKRGVDVYLALLSALAPLVVLDLIVGPDKIAELPSSTGKHKNTAEDVASECTFITQARTASDGCASSASGHGTQTQKLLSKGAISCDWRDHGATHHLRGIEHELIDADGGHSFPIRNNKTAPRQAYFLALAEALLAMYRCGGGCFCPTTTADQITPTTGNSHDNGSPTPLPFPDNAETVVTSGSEDVRGTLSSEVLKLKGMIDATLDGCGTLSSSLCNSDTASLARIFSEDNYHHHADREEISILRRNLLTVSKRLGGTRPPADDESRILLHGDLPDECKNDSGCPPSTAGG